MNIFRNLVFLLKRKDINSTLIIEAESPAETSVPTNPTTWRQIPQNTCQNIKYFDRSNTLSLSVAITTNHPMIKVRNLKKIHFYEAGKWIVN